MKTQKKKLLKCVAGLIGMTLLTTSTFTTPTFAMNETNNTLSASTSGDVAVPYATSMYLGQVKFTGQNTGSWRTVPGNHVRMCIAFKPVDGISYGTELYVSLYQYPSVYIGRFKCNNYTVTPDADGYYFFVSDYFNINPNSDCQLRYLATSSGTSYDPRSVDVHAWFDYY